jgi:hypothetical protein
MKAFLRLRRIVLLPGFENLLCMRAVELPLLNSSMSSKYLTERRLSQH